MHELGEVEGGELEGIHPRTDLGQVQDIVDQRSQPVRFVDDDLRVLRPFFRIVSGDLLYHGRVCLDHRQRRFEIVRDVREHFLLQGVGLAYLLFRVVQRFGEGIHLRIGIFAREIHGEISRRHALCRRREPRDGLGQLHGQQRGYDQRKENDDDGNEDELHAHGTHRTQGGFGGIVDVQIGARPVAGIHGIGAELCDVCELFFPYPHAFARGNVFPVLARDIQRGERGVEIHGAFIRRVIVCLLGREKQRAVPFDDIDGNGDVFALHLPDETGDVFLVPRNGDLVFQPYIGDGADGFKFVLRFFAEQHAQERGLKYPGKRYDECSE